MDRWGERQLVTIALAIVVMTLVYVARWVWSLL